MIRVGDVQIIEAWNQRGKGRGRIRASLDACEDKDEKEKLASQRPK
jgi:hypothetical protein